jgi:CheY-like chemotaxis protein
MASVLVCPFCRTREPEVAADGSSAFLGEGDEEAYECPCGAVAFRSPNLQRGVRQEEARALETVRACVGAGPSVPIEMKWNATVETGTPARLLWVQKGGSGAPAPAPAAARAPEGPRAAAEALPGPTKVLCIDDDRFVLDWLAMTLKTHGFVPLTALDGPTGIALAQAEVPQLIVVDIMMPGMDGFEVCRRLKDETRTHAIPLIILTARTDPKLNIQAFRCGADLALTKPIQPDKLMGTLRAALALKQDRR